MEEGYNHNNNSNYYGSQHEIYDNENSANNKDTYNLIFLIIVKIKIARIINRLIES